MSKLPVLKGENELLDYVRAMEKVPLVTLDEESLWSTDITVSG